MKVPQFSSIHPWYILWILCDQYRCDPFPCLFVQWWTNLTNVSIDELRGMSIPVWMIRAHDISHTIKGNSKKCPSFHSFPMLHTSLEYCVASIYVIPLLGYLCNGISTSIMNIMMNWRCCRHLYRWLKLMVHHTQSKAEAKSVPVFFHSCWTIHWVLCGQYGCDTLALELVQWCISPLMNREWCQHLNWCLDLIIHHTPSQAEYESAPVFIHPPMVHPLDIVWPV